jgi:hypothetical protein
MGIKSRKGTEKEEYRERSEENMRIRAGKKKD